METEKIAKSFALLSRAEKGQDIVIRDDQSEFSCLLDAARVCRQKGLHFRLIDSGKLTPFELEWLGESGAEIYTSDEARPDASQVLLVARAAQKGHSFVSFFQEGLLEENEKQGRISFGALAELGRNGVYLHLSNREKTRDVSQLIVLAESCRKGQSALIYYHHGSLNSALIDLSRSGAWIHISDKSFREKDDINSLLDMTVSSSQAGSRVVLHVERGMNIASLQKIFEAGASLHFKTPLTDHHSPLRALERRAKKRKLDSRYYYLYTTFLP